MTHNHPNSSDFDGTENPSRTTTLSGLGLAPFKILGSLLIALILMSLLLLVLAWGTFVESEYGTAVGNFALYDSRWFVLLWGLLGLNIAFSMLARLPWKRHNIPFLLSHFGILVLLAGCYLTWSLGESAQITLPEGAAGEKAMKMNRQHFEIQMISHDTVLESKSKTVDVPFEPGPFNWEDYVRENWFRSNDRKFRDTLWWAMQWGHRDQGSLAIPASLSGIKIEVLDYYASSTELPASPLELSILWKKVIKSHTELGEVRETPRKWETVKLDIKPNDRGGRMEIRGARTEMDGGERVDFFVTTSMREVAAFRRSEPDLTSKFGPWGQIVFHFNDKNCFVDVEQLVKQTDSGKRFPLPGTPLEIGDVRFLSRGPIIRFAVYSPGGEKEYMVLDAKSPDINIQARQFGLFGTYWFDPGRLTPAQAGPDESAALEPAGRPRLDLLQGPDQKLYYRFWTGKNIASSGEVPSAAPGKKPTFTVAAQTPDEAEVVVERFYPHDLPGQRIASLPVGKERGTVQRVKLRVSLDGNEDTFWLRAAYPSVIPLPPESDQVRYVYGNNRTAQIVWNYDSINLGFGIFLKTFEQRNEPGTRMSSYYSSLVDFVKFKKEGERIGYTRSMDEFTTLEENVLIRMNQPAVFKGNGQHYRIYQSSYQGPFHPGDVRYQELYDGKIFPWEKAPRESLYMSTLSINKDPGRGLKYLGSFLIVFGVAWLIYRKK